MRKIIAIILAVLSAFAAFGQSEADSVKVYFSISRGKYNPLFGGNEASMNSFIEAVRISMNNEELDHIEVRGYTSPEGPLNLNDRLAARRCESVAAYIIEHTGVSPELVRIEPEGVAWDELRRLVEVADYVPARYEILGILASPEYGRNDRIRNLGAPYLWLLSNIYPKLRYTLAINVCLKSVGDDMALSADSVPAPEGSDAIGSSITITQVDSLFINGPLVITDESEEVIAADSVPDWTPRHRMALKTNMLYYAALMPNLELEWLINDNWSASIEGNVAWWDKQSHDKCYRIAVIDAEVRRWINIRSPWHGLYAGVFAGGGWYDFENEKGYRGEGGMAGLSLGYMWPVGRSLSLEASVGAGYLYSRYKEYIPYDGHYLYQRTKTLNYFGPLKLKLSIAWRFWDANKPRKIKTQI